MKTMGAREPMANQQHDSCCRDGHCPPAQSALNLIVPRGQAVYVLGLMFSLAFAALEFMFFIALMSQQGENK
jgi:hypothetical protein